MSIQESLNQASQQLITGKLLSAKETYLFILDQDPKNVDALQGLSVIAFQLDDIDQVSDYLLQAVAIDPKHSECYRSLGIFYLNQREWNKATQALETAKALKEKKRRVTRQYLSVLLHLSSIYLLQERYKEAGKLIRKILRHEPQHPQALSGLFTIQTAHKRFKKAGEMLIKFVHRQVDLDCAQGYLYLLQDRYSDAIRLCERAMKEDPANPGRYVNLGFCYDQIRDYETCIKIYGKGLELDPLHPQLLCLMLSAKINGCDWKGRTEVIQKLFENTDIEAEEKIFDHIDPGIPILAGLNNTELKRIAQGKSTQLLDKTEAIRQYQQFSFKKDRKKKLRIAYASSDYHNHPTSHLILQLFALHDRSRFEIFAYSWGKNDRSHYRKKLEQDSDHFVDIRGFTDSQAAQKIYDDQIDIMIDLQGYTKNARIKIFALRPAPIQVNYLGYPSTIGGSFIDYLIADRTIIPLDQQKFFSEKIVYMPYCYQMVNDTKQIAPTIPSRKKYGLPADAFVFSCFNQNNKIDQAVAEMWMQILQHVPNSVFWFLETCPRMHKRLCEVGRAFGISPKRIIPCPGEPNPKHLARMQLADLFLDTLVCSAHTTCNDSLWTGLPLLTCLGETFASRVAASLLKNIGIPELIAKDRKSYIVKAIELAKNPNKLSRIQEKIVRNRHILPLFQSEQQTRFLEEAYLQMWELYLSGKKPKTFSVSKKIR